MRRSPPRGRERCCGRPGRGRPQGPPLARDV